MATIASPGHADEFDAIAVSTPDNRSAGPHERWLLANLPRSRGTALDIGCGTGYLTRRLAASFDHAVAIDSSEKMIAEARGRSEGASIEYACADLFDWLERHRETYDCIVSVATLHHVDPERALRAIALSLKPGGRLLVLDLLDCNGMRHAVSNAAAWLVARGYQLFAPGRIMPRKLRAAWRDRRGDHQYLTIEQARDSALRELPGARVRAHLLWRYSVIWDKPAAM